MRVSPILSPRDRTHHLAPSLPILRLLTGRRPKDLDHLVPAGIGTQAAWGEQGGREEGKGE